MNKSRKATLTVLSMIMAMVLSKGLGMVRSMCMAAVYGTGQEAIAFSTASRIPLSFFDLLFSASILGCFIPVYNSFKKKDGDATDIVHHAQQKADTFACIFLNFVLLLTGAVSVVGMLLAPQLIHLITPGLSDDTAALAAALLRIMFPMILFTASAYTLVGILQSKDSFFLPSMISAISNLGIILYFLFIDRMLGENSIYGLAIAYLIAWALQFLTLMVPLIKMRFPYRAYLDLKNPALRRAIKMTPPIMIGSWLAPIGMLTGTHFAAELSVSGSVTIFEYAININNILTGILTYGICNFTFPKLSRMNGTDPKAFSSTARSALLSAVAVVLPVMAAVFVLAEEGTAILYLRGAFTAEDTILTTQALRCFAIGMPAFCLTEMISRIMYARMSVRVPMISSLCGVAINLLSTAILVHTVSDNIHVGAVALGNSLGLITCALILCIVMIRSIPDIINRDFVFSLLKLILLSAAAFVVMSVIAHVIGNSAVQSSLFINLGTCILVFVPAALLYLCGLRILSVRFH